MRPRIRHLQHTCRAALLCVVMAAAHAAPAQGPDLDLAIHYYSRVVTPEGVLRDSRYQERMMRRADHVWKVRVLPDTPAAHGADAAPAHHEREHKHFNHVMLPRHVLRSNGQVRLEYVDFREREVVSISPSEYENVNFDGSWTNAFFLVDPKAVAALPLTNRASPVAGARWRETSKGSAYQRVLWDENRMIPLLIQKGDAAGRTLERIEIMPQPTLAKALPWAGAKAFAQKEYAEFLD